MITNFLLMTGTWYDPLGPAVEAVGNARFWLRLQRLLSSGVCPGTLARDCNQLLGALASPRLVGTPVELLRPAAVLGEASFHKTLEERQRAAYIASRGSRQRLQPH